MIGRLAWVTARPARGRDDDQPLAVSALRQAGAVVSVIDWDDPRADWASFDRVVLRSTWDYPERLLQFHAWLDSVAAASDLRNPAPMVRWSTDKHYLGELDAAGIPVIATTFVEPGQSAQFPGGEFVVKPAVGAGSRGAASYNPGHHDLNHHDLNHHDLAAAHVRRLHAAGSTALVQPRVASVAHHGECALVFLGGEYSHAARKRVRLPHASAVDDLFAAEDLQPVTADTDQRAIAQAVLEMVTARFGVPTYARVDLVQDDAGQPMVLEVELVEPSLFLPQAGPQAVHQLVRAFLR
ncbi:MAG: ATP-grasp domain-containing protein [Angustibacter sp.]